ncbi:hypothetical protein CDL15_Pgr021213 [Punica granatum]|uniref:GRF-type domain-containing protein n=1 Tax=Punica granatum TaxID=22663 RepID=A0A218WXF4_PUNGR|nr:hypothetical protein CDL15_Pgr021213 [Punica granatum]
MSCNSQSEWSCHNHRRLREDSTVYPKRRRASSLSMSNDEDDGFCDCKRRKSSRSSNRDEDIYCHSRRRALRMISNTKCNPGRAFYRCPQRRNKGLSCDYFEWEDEIGLSNSSPNQRLISELRRRNATNELPLKRLDCKCAVVCFWVALMEVAFGSSHCS